MSRFFLRGGKKFFRVTGVMSRTFAVLFTEKRGNSIGARLNADFYSFFFLFTIRRKEFRAQTCVYIYKYK